LRLDFKLTVACTIHVSIMNILLLSANAIIMKRKLKAVLVNKSTNINKANNYLSTLLTEHIKRDHDISSWKSKS
jgi:hypothetical protein